MKVSSRPWSGMFLDITIVGRVVVGKMGPQDTRNYGKMIHMASYIVERQSSRRRPFF